MTADVFQWITLILLVVILALMIVWRR